jgi:hypothetical protein
MSDLYKGKFFYEIVKVLSGRYVGTLQLIGPLDNIRYVNEDVSSKYREYKFVQVVEGKIVAAFSEKEILVTDRIL